MKRESEHKFHMDLAEKVSTRSTCIRDGRQIGAVLVKDGILLATGYNGPPHGLDHCKTCYRQDHNIASTTRMELCRAVHAEENAILQCAKKQTNPEGAVLYCTHSPCVTCAKTLIQCKIQIIIFKHVYPDELGMEMLKQADIPLININEIKKLEFEFMRRIRND